jgi:hypothetical protein
MTTDAYLVSGGVSEAELAALVQETQQKTKQELAQLRLEFQHHNYYLMRLTYNRIQQSINHLENLSERTTNERDCLDAFVIGRHPLASRFLKASTVSLPNAPVFIFSRNEGTTNPTYPLPYSRPPQSPPSASLRIPSASSSTCQKCDRVEANTFIKALIDPNPIVRAGDWGVYDGSQS